MLLLEGNCTHVQRGPTPQSAARFTAHQNNHARFSLATDMTWRNTTVSLEKHDGKVDDGALCNLFSEVNFSQHVSRNSLCIWLFSCAVREGKEEMLKVGRKSVFAWHLTRHACWENRCEFAANSDRQNQKNSTWTAQGWNPSQLREALRRILDTSQLGNCAVTFSRVTLHLRN